MKNVLIDLGEQTPSEETVRQSAHNLIGLFRLLAELDQRQKQPTTNQSLPK